MKHQSYIAGIILIGCTMLKGCKPAPAPLEAKPAVRSTIAPKGMYEVFEPLEKSTTKEGEAVFGKDTFIVYQEYTGGIAFKQPVKSTKGEDGIMNYREMVVRLVNEKSGDTVSFSRDTFREYIHPDDRSLAIMQSVAFAEKSKKGVVPFTVNLCQPDSDSCYFFDVRPNGKGGFTITDVTEDFEMP